MGRWRVRVVELTKVWAGPYAGKLLAMLGAEVIKVETAGSPEEMRAYGGTDVNHAPYFLSINPEILSVDLDIKSAEGMARLRELIARSDIVINNLRPGAMERQGLDYARLEEIKPDVISVSIKMWGNDGPLGHQTGYAPCFAALAGLARWWATRRAAARDEHALRRFDRRGSGRVRGRGGAAAPRTHRSRAVRRPVGGGDPLVDDRGLPARGSPDRAATRAQRQPSPGPVPARLLPCADGAWIAIAVAGDPQWRGMCDVLGAGALARERRYATMGERRRHAESLDADLSRLTRSQDAEHLAHRLRAAGVPAVKSATALDVIGDQRLWDRGLYRFVSDHREGQRPIVGPSWRMARDPARIARGAPDLGEHTEYVLQEILGA